MAGFSVRFHLPSPRLRPLISTYYLVGHEPGPAEPLVDLLHPEWANMRLILRGRWRTDSADGELDSASDPALEGMLYGPTSHAVRFTSESGMLLGIGLLPLGWGRLVRRAASEYADRVVPLCDVLGDDVAALLAGLRGDATLAGMAARLDAYFEARMAPMTPMLAAAERAHAVLLDGELGTVARFAELLDISPRQLERISRAHFGFSPKLLLRRQRFLRTLARIQAAPGERWTTLLDPLYFDQSHFIRDFQHFMAMSPSRYFALPRVMLAKAAEARRALLGQSLQGLHPPQAEAAARLADVER